MIATGLVVRVDAVFALAAAGHDSLASVLVGFAVQPGLRREYETEGRRKRMEIANGELKLLNSE